MTARYVGPSGTIERKFTVSQGFSPLLDLTLAVSDVTDVTAKLTITPSDEKETYSYMGITKADYEAAGSDTEIIESYVARMQTEADKYGMPLTQYLKGYVLKSGTLETQLSALTPETEYFAVAFALDSTGRHNGEIFKSPFTTRKGSGTVDVTFELKANIENGNVVTMNVKPSDDNVRYYWSCITTAYLEYLGKDLPSAVKHMVDEHIMYGVDAGLSVEECVDEISSYGEQTYTEEMVRDTDFILFAVAITEQGGLVSDVASLEFRTENVSASDNVITIEITDVAVDNATLVITTTNDDPYAVAINESSAWAGMSGEEMANAAITVGNYNPLSGDYTGVARRLTANTDYTVIAFGYQDGQLTTAVTQKMFTTMPSGNSSDLTFQFTITDPTPYGATVTVNPDPANALYFWYTRPSDMEADEVLASIDEIIQNYIASGMISSRIDYFKMAGSRGPETSTLRSLESDTEYRAFAVGIDETDGSYVTDVFFSEPFRTTVRREADVVVNVEVEAYFDGTEVEKQYPDYEGATGMAVVSLLAEVEGEYQDYYFHLFQSDLSDTGKYTDQAIINALLSQGFRNSTHEHVYAMFGQTYTLLSVGVDDTGNYGKVIRKTVSFSKDGVTDISEFTPLGLEGAPAASRAQTVQPQTARVAKH